MKYLLFIFFLSCSEIPTESYKPIEVEFYGDDLTFFNAVNNDRLSRNIAVLKGENQLTKGCVTQSYFMWVVGYANHNGFYQRAVNSKADTFSEVVCGRYISPEAMFEAYVNSSEHYSKLIDSTKTHIGISNIGGYQCVNLASYK